MFRRRKWELLALVLWSAGCTAMSSSNTARTATEQLLVANAVDQSLDKVNFSAFSGYDVFLQEKYVDCVDKNYVIASTRHRLFKAGARLVDAPDKADVVVELRSGGVGTGSASSFIGTPEVVLPGMLAIPEIKLIERSRQEAAAKIGIVAYDPKTNQSLGDGGISLARSDDNNWYVAGVGPFQNGTIRKEISESTTGDAARVQGRVAPVVAFKAPGVSPESDYAAEEPAKRGIQPVSLDEFLPAWARTRKEADPPPGK